jgi:glycosyltransferase involved in cell wall biosynthesis
VLSVSAIIPTHNHARFVGRAVGSALGQSWPAVEVIVVDDGSTDGTGQVLAAFEGRIVVIRQPNRGLSPARNAGARAASGDLLAFLDADDEWYPTKLERQVARFERNPGVGLVHCGVEEVDGQGRRLKTCLDGMDGWVSREMLLFRRGVILGGGSASVVSRRAFADVGGFDESLSTSADWDFYYRLARRWEVDFVPEVLVRYRVHGSNMHMNIHAMERDMLRAYAKVFSEDDPDLQGLRRVAYGRLHAVLAGSFFRARRFRESLGHAIRSVGLTPGTVTYFAAYPLRAFRRAANRLGRA